MALVVAAFVVGVFVASRVSAPPFLLAAAALGTVAAAVLLRRPRCVRTIALLASVVMLGILRSDADPRFPDWLLLRAPRVTEITGSVVSYPSLGVDRIRFAVQPDDLPGKVLATWECPGSPAGAVHYGDRVRLVGRTERPGIFDGFDYAAYLERQGVFATMSVEAPSLSHFGARSSVLRTGDRVRQTFLGLLQRRLRPDDFALAQSYVFGDRFALSDETEEAFASTGLVHILAVSGMHLAVLLAGAWWVLRALRLRPAFAYPLLAIGVLAAVWIIGPWISFARSALLFAFIAAGGVLADLGLTLRSAVRPMNALAAAALVLLLVQPNSLFDVGFQLSVAATAGLLVFAPHPTGSAPRRGQVAADRPRLARRLRRAASSLFLVSLSAQAGAAPILAWQFDKLQCWTAITGLVAIPVSSLALWLGVVALAVSAVGPISGIATSAFGWSLRAFESVVVAAERLPWTTLPADGRIGLWLAGLVVFLACARHVLEGLPVSGREAGSSRTPGSDGITLLPMAPGKAITDNGRGRLTGGRRVSSLVRNDAHRERVPDRAQSDPAADTEAGEAPARALCIFLRDLDCASDTAHHRPRILDARRGCRLSARRGSDRRGAGAG
jgi:competence protein ComEC